ncbi:MAG: hydroxyethylthiazole kinase [Chlamydiota bacterium]
MNIKAFTYELVCRIRKGSPLIHNITNFVAMNSSANILLAVGASPVMAHSRDEVGEMTSLADALVLNIGTLQKDWVGSMICAAQAANRKGIPVILDPVGAGATSLRSEAVRAIMSEASISVLRGNASEVFSLASDGAGTRGVDSSLPVSADVIRAAGEMALKKNCIIVISGEKDFITDGRRTFRVENGRPIMARVTGLGCGLSAVTAAFCAVAGGELLHASTAAAALYGLCGEMAERVSARPGSFFVAFIDALYSVGKKEIDELLLVREEEHRTGD